MHLYVNDYVTMSPCHIVRRIPGQTKTTATAEESSGMSTKQVLGYLWPVSLLKKHQRPVPATKKLQSVLHQGKNVKGAILEEWTVGALFGLKEKVFRFPTIFGICH